MTLTKNDMFKKAFTKEVLEAYKNRVCTPLIKELIHDAGSACVRRIVNGK